MRGWSLYCLLSFQFSAQTFFPLQGKDKFPLDEGYIFESKFPLVVRIRLAARACGSGIGPSPFDSALPQGKLREMLHKCTSWSFFYTNNSFILCWIVHETNPYCNLHCYKSLYNFRAIARNAVGRKYSSISGKFCKFIFRGTAQNIFRFLFCNNGIKSILHHARLKLKIIRVGGKQCIYQLSYWVTFITVYW